MIPKKKTATAAEDKETPPSRLSYLLCQSAVDVRILPVRINSNSPIR